ncbi:MAG: AAA domain-containing protein [Methanoculleus sp.]|mgnify:CR=1 FL=1|uniref:bifunctional RecB family nuclease/DEAD/DEAH box helicase n=2 Tax=Methanoculleus TaxID=45989 RepID=UPI0025ED6090|nr:MULTISPECIES: AAA domain-containing protein [unclassified Methanoculleus]MCK9317268.1 AAA domain-containing protein [Methanoculleus sp.]MDD2253152.1 AAA domain-containing protein [Methanoculleus sp.]MDD3215828.1 AAA domain-containing protein [Methanoculleus sp.]MDD4313737.1 AAA domain-containing protein [Methanoculleus sp.]MDD4471181.1 AAA domain-containing protein [Methanoculleus sp.]
MPRFNLSPSLIGWFFYHDCERYLRYHATPEQEREAAGIPAVATDRSPVTQALLAAGIRWEEEVVRTKLTGRVRVPDGTGPLSGRSFSIEESFNLLPRLTPGEVLYQSTIPVSVHFLRNYGLNPDLHRFSPCRPDLIRFGEGSDGEPALSVIDIKASEDLSVSHRIQATLYALILDHALTLLGIDLPVDLDRAGIWLYGEDEPETFRLHLNVRVIEDFFRHRIPGVFAGPAADVPWHITSRCESCEFYPHCRHEAETTGSVSQIPGLSSVGRRYLREAAWNGGRPINTLDDLAGFLSDPESDRCLDGCGSLAGRGDRLRETVRAIRTGEVVPLAATSLALPIFEDVGLVLTLQKDPVSGRVYALGFRRNRGNAVYGTPSREEIFIAADEGDCDRIRREFVRALAAELSAVDEYNQDREWADKKSVQTYVYDTYEEDLFTRLIVKAIEDPATAEDALRLRFYYQDPGIATGSAHPSGSVPFPLVVLTREIRRLLALPVPFTLRMPEVLAAIPSSRFAYRLNAGDLFWNEQSNAMKSDAVIMAWSGSQPEAADWIRQEVSRRLIAAGSILDGLRERVKGNLVRWAENFRFPRPWDAETPEISRLLFIAEYESAVGAQKVQEMRSRPRDAGVRDGISIPLRKSEGNFWKVLAPLDLALFEQSQVFSYLLVRDDDAGREAQLSFEDARYRASMNPGRSGACFAMVRDSIVDRKAGLVRGLVLEVTYGQGFPPFEEGDLAVLHPRFTDFTVERAVERLLDLDAQPGNAFIRLLRDPRGFAVPVREREEVVCDAERLARDSGFTKSQERAFRQVLENRLTLVWGPPGTGKTHFLANALLSLVKARRVHGEQVRIGVTAFTHAAIENLLVKVQESVGEFGLDTDLAIYKLKGTRTARGERSLEALPHERADTVVGCPSLLLGGTVHSFGKLEKSLPSLDLLIVDEASQMRPAELAMVLSVLGREGRLVLAGDDLQLPPVVQGAYPPPEDGLPGLEDSIFAYLRHRDDAVRPAYTCQLQENWRMNRTLSRFAAETLYGPGYAPATDAVGGRHIALAEGAAEEYIEWVLDPAYPLVLCVLENVRTTVENRIEAGLAARLACTLRERLIDPDTGRPYPAGGDGDARFWQHGLFIVSPHHAQIGAVQESLARERAWESRPFVDTVDKMQGQEAEAVIVSYGVSDVETALAEAEFIYSRNRLNVSLTRSRAKCVVFLPRPLLEPPLDLVGDETAAAGLEHMLDLQEFCRTHGEMRTFSLDGEAEGVRLTVMRAQIE